MFVYLFRNNPDSLIFRKCPTDMVCVTPGVYALVGSAALLASTTNMTGIIHNNNNNNLNNLFFKKKFIFDIILATIVIIMFELTGALIYVLPIMIAGKYFYNNIR